MSDNFKLEVISPNKTIFNSDVKQVTIPAFEGLMTILKDHISLVTFLRPGFIEIDTNNEEVKFFVEEGTVEFSKNNLTATSIYSGRSHVGITRVKNFVIHNGRGTIKIAPPPFVSPFLKR